ncbi:hypothetical protein K449DRAFT_462614 [Hypoxylon sp. EC38]|nr:hypothetical protein K449DRAFT_462614 [Hypoxylon sp. EC38]
MSLRYDKRLWKCPGCCRPLWQTITYGLMEKGKCFGVMGEVYIFDAVTNWLVTTPFGSRVQPVSTHSVSYILDVCRVRYQTQEHHKTENVLENQRGLALKDAGSRGESWGTTSLRDQYQPQSEFRLIGTITLEYKALGRRTGWFKSPPQLFGITKDGPCFDGEKDLRPLANRKLQIVPNLSLGPTGTKSQEPKYSRIPLRKYSMGPPLAKVRRGWRVDLSGSYTPSLTNIKKQMASHSQKGDNSFDGANSSGASASYHMV